LLGPGQTHAPNILRFKTQHLACGGVFQGRCAAKHPEIARTATLNGQRAITISTQQGSRIGPVTTAEQHTALLRGHQARCLGKLGFVDDLRLGQEWLDELH